MKALLRGELDAEEVREQLFFCLDCRACETACPSGVRFGALVERGRVEVGRHRKRSLPSLIAWFLAFDGLLSDQGKIDGLADILHLYQVSGLQKLLRRSGMVEAFWPALRHMAELLPTVPSRSQRKPLPEKITASGPSEDRAAFFTGCVMHALYPHVNRDTVALLTATGCDVLVPGDLCCCGALHFHAGHERGAMALARRNIDAFERSGADKLIVNSAGCGAMLKEYPILLKNDPLYARRAQAFSRRVMDISEYLINSRLNGKSRRLEMTVVYDEPCHLLHAQGVSSEPKKLIASIPGVTMLPLKEADKCCGAAGTYNITHREFSIKLLDIKMGFIKKARPDAIVTGNPGCLMQLGYGVRRWKLDIPVIHTAQLLSRAFTDSHSSQQT
jgi:glycolate oxidase iron-sulfur subunit